MGYLGVQFTQIVPVPLYQPIYPARAKNRLDEAVVTSVALRFSPQSLEIPSSSFRNPMDQIYVTAAAGRFENAKPFESFRTFDPNIPHGRISGLVTAKQLNNQTKTTITPPDDTFADTIEKKEDVEKRKNEKKAEQLRSQRPQSVYSSNSLNNASANTSSQISLVA